MLLVAAVVIFVEKTIPNSRHVARPLGFFMVAGGVAVIVMALLGGMAPGMETV